MSKYTADPKRIMKAVLGPSMLHDNEVKDIAESIYNLAIKYADDPAYARERIRQAIEATVLVEHAKVLSVVMAEGELTG